MEHSEYNARDNKFRPGERGLGLYSRLWLGFIAAIFIFVVGIIIALIQAGAASAGQLTLWITLFVGIIVALAAFFLTSHFIITPVRYVFNLIQDLACAESNIPLDAQIIGEAGVAIQGLKSIQEKLQLSQGGVGGS